MSEGQETEVEKTQEPQKKGLFVDQLINFVLRFWQMS